MRHRHCVKRVSGGELYLHPDRSDIRHSAVGKGAISSNGINVGTAGVLGGAQAGCDLQFAKHWIVGVSADAAGANIQGSTAQTNSFGTGPVTSFNSSGSLNAQTNFISTFTGRFGYSMGGGLFYVKGGGAYEQSSYSFGGNVASTSCYALTPIAIPNPVPLPTPSCGISNPSVNQQFNFGASTNSRFGWTIGIGTEWMVYGGLSVVAEYNYLDFGTHAVTFSDQPWGPKTSTSRNTSTSSSWASTIGLTSRLILTVIIEIN